jgi:hypothetical protein
MELSCEPPVISFSVAVFEFVHVGYRDRPLLWSIIPILRILIQDDVLKPEPLLCGRKLAD